MIALDTTTLDLDVIRIDGGTQARVAINQDVVAGYADRMEAGDVFPPVDVFHDGSEYYLADGFHRVMASTRNGLIEITAEIHKGTKDDALWFALSANRRNGHRMERGDVRRCIELALETWPERTQSDIAEHVGCSQSWVADVKSQLIGTDKFVPPPTRVGKDGKERPTTYKPRREPPAVIPDVYNEPGIPEPNYYNISLPVKSSNAAARILCELCTDEYLRELAGFISDHLEGNDQWQ